MRGSLLAVALCTCAGAIGASGCKERGQPSASREVAPYTSVDQVFAEPIFRAFEQQSGIRTRGVFDTEETKSTGVLNRLIAEAAQPRADVFWSGDPVRPFLLIKRGLVEPYVSPGAAALPERFKAKDGAWTGVAARARVLIVNKDRIPAAARPKSIHALIDPRWQGQVTIANPLFGTTTMHVAALFSAWGAVPAKKFLDDLKRNKVRIASSNGEVKRLVVAGEMAFGLTDTDDAFEAMKDGAPVEMVYPDQDALGTLVMPTTVVLIKGGPSPEAGKKLIDYLVSDSVEAAMSRAGAHMPLRAGVPAPAGVRPMADVKAMTVDYGLVAETMEKIQPWLREWVGL
jgi:iron(III) transport system substrate-binding protein